MRKSNICLIEVQPVKLYVPCILFPKTNHPVSLNSFQFFFKLATNFGEKDPEAILYLFFFILNIRHANRYFSVLGKGAEHL